MASGKVSATLAFRGMSLWHIDHVSFKQCNVCNAFVFFENTMSASLIAIPMVVLITKIILINNRRGLVGYVRNWMSLYP